MWSNEPERLLYSARRHLHLTSWSPDGKWLAYTLNEGGSSEVNVVSFPSLSGKRQVFRGAGAAVQWSKTGATGLELYCLSFDAAMGTPQLVAVPAISSADNIAFQQPQRLFELRGALVPSLDARSFFMIIPNPDSPAREIRVVTSWLDEVLASEAAPR